MTLPTRSVSIRAPFCPGRRRRRCRRGRSPLLSRQRYGRAARCSACTAACPCWVRSVVGCSGPLGQPRETRATNDPLPSPRAPLFHGRPRPAMTDAIRAAHARALASAASAPNPKTTYIFGNRSFAYPSRSCDIRSRIFQRVSRRRGGSCAQRKTPSRARRGRHLSVTPFETASPRASAFPPCFRIEKSRVVLERGEKKGVPRIREGIPHAYQ